MPDKESDTSDMTARQIIDAILMYQDSDSVRKTSQRIPIDPTTKKNTERVWARIPVELTEWVSSKSDEPGFKSREMLLCAALGFAASHERKFLEYCTDSRMATDLYGVESGNVPNVQGRESDTPDSDTLGGSTDTPAGSQSAESSHSESESTQADTDQDEMNTDGVFGKPQHEQDEYEQGPDGF